jgi:predicted nucleic-acid-binding protein
MVAQTVIIAADTNVLVRYIMDDDPRQGEVARALFESAESIAISNVALCELAWVLANSYKTPRGDITRVMQQFLNTSKIVLDHNAVLAGLDMLEAGGDFADGVIAHEGQWLGAEEFVSFDKVAVKKLVASGLKARVLTR